MPFSMQANVPVCIAGLETTTQSLVSPSTSYPANWSKQTRQLRDWMYSDAIEPNSPSGLLQGYCELGYCFIFCSTATCWTVSDRDLLCRKCHSLVATKWKLEKTICEIKNTRWSIWSPLELELYKERPVEGLTFCPGFPGPPTSPVSPCDRNNTQSH